jgi:hypothetical protein
MSRVLPRRTFLRGAAGIAVALPFLDAMLPRRAQAQAVAAPLRFGVMFSPNGLIPADWTPSGGETDFVLGPELAALSLYRSDINVLHGLNNETSYMQDGNPHDLSMSHMLTCMRMKVNAVGRANHVVDGTAGGPSIDQALAKAIGNDTKLRSLELGVQSTTTDLEPMVIRMSYGGPGDPRTPLDDPKQVFTRLFGDTQASQAAIDALHKQRKSVLDAVLSEFNSVNGSLGYDDKQKLARHADAIRDIENQLNVVTNTNSNCVIPSAAPNVPVTVYDCTVDDPPRPAKCLSGFPDIGKAQMDLMVLAFACDITRVATLQWSTAESVVVHSQLGIANEHHLMSHDPTNHRADLTKINTWYTQQFAYLISELKKLPEGDGTVLDNTLLFWPNELFDGDVHNRRNLPYVLAGKAGGQLQTGRYLQFNGNPHNQLYATFLNMYGVPTTSFGESAYPGTLSGLV